jgi:ParB family chromosome partitioning protein
MEATGCSQEEVAVKVGKNRSTVANALRLLNLPFEMQQSVQYGDISAGHARALLAVKDEKARNGLFDDILRQGLSVREAESVARAANIGKKKPGKAGLPGSGASPGASKLLSPEMAAMQEKFIQTLGTKVVIDGDMEHGKVVIEYYSMEDLERLYDILGGNAHAEVQ